jgi:trehalose/maltose transport system substrate-binding protein
VSSAFWNSAHEVISGKARAEDSLKKLDSKLESIRRGATW